MFLRNYTTISHVLCKLLWLFWKHFWDGWDFWKKRISRFLELKEIYRLIFIYREEFLDRFWELYVSAYFEILIKLCSVYDMISIWEFSYLILCTVTYRWELDPCNKDSHPSHPSHPSRPSRVPVMMNIFFELSRANYLVVLDFISMLELLLLGIQVNILWGLLKAILRIPGKGILSDRYVTARCMAW